MKSRMLLTFGSVVAVLAATLGMTVGTSNADVSASARTPVYWIDLGGTASQHPDFVFFTADAGGYMEDVTWRHWGRYRTVGHGTFGTSAPCNPGQPCPSGPATIVMRKPVRCTPEFGSKKGKKVRVYRHARLTYPDGEGGTLHADITDRAGWASCREAH